MSIVQQESGKPLAGCAGNRKFWAPAGHCCYPTSASQAICIGQLAPLWGAKSMPPVGRHQRRTAPWEGRDGRISRMRTALEYSSARVMSTIGSIGSMCSDHSIERMGTCCLQNYDRPVCCPGRTGLFGFRCYLPEASISPPGMLWPCQGSVALFQSK